MIVGRWRSIRSKSSSGRRALREDDPGRADAEGEERRRVARVAEEELRHGQHDVVLGRSRRTSTAKLSYEISGSCIRWHGGLRRAGRARRELPERRVVLRRCRPRSSASEAAAAASSKDVSPRPRLGADDEDRGRGREPAHRLAHVRERRLVDDHDPGPRVAEVVGVVLGREERVRLGDDRPDLERGVPARDELGAVGEREQDAVLRPTPRSSSTLPARFWQRGAAPRTRRVASP